MQSSFDFLDSLPDPSLAFNHDDYLTTSSNEPWKLDWVDCPPFKLPVEEESKTKKDASNAMEVDEKAKENDTTLTTHGDANMVPSTLDEAYEVSGRVLLKRTWLIDMNFRMLHASKLLSVSST